jgi:hypothetical protein
MNNERRIGDDKIEEIIHLVREIHQRQTEKTIPAIVKIEHTLYGNSKIGLCDYVVGLDSKLTATKYFFGIILIIIAIAVSIIELFIRSK